MTDQDKELRKLAQAATQGRWKVGQYLGSPRQFVIHMDVGDKGRGSDIAFASASFDNDTTIANARLIAAANPAAITELLDRLEAAENLLAGVSDQYEEEKTKARAFEQELAAMKKQEPVMWANSANIASAKINQERGGIGDQHTCAETRTAYHDAPLYVLPGAQGEVK